MSGSHEITHWPTTPDELVLLQKQLAVWPAEPWVKDGPVHLMAGCWICHPKGHAGGGQAGDRCWAAASLLSNGRLIAAETIRGLASADYQPGLLALREGPLLEAAVMKLAKRPDVLLVNATGRDHPRRAGLALHLGAKLSIPTVGVTRQPLLAKGSVPADERGATAVLKIGEEIVACRLKTQPGALPLVVHSGWRTDLETAVAVVMESVGRWRTPEPLREARRAARETRARDNSPD